MTSEIQLKRLRKNSPWVNFTNFLQAVFSTKVIHKLPFVFTFKVCAFSVQLYWRKSCSLDVGEIDSIVDSSYDFAQTLNIGN